jgi:hypothetical protein
MVINESVKISNERVQAFAWSGLRQFHNIAFTAEQHARLHGVLPSDQNVKKQATQIRDCLMQAKEYFDASKVVTLATKPVLMHYSVLSLAIAEILMKNDGNVSLDRARVEHNHHGLNLRTSLSNGNISDISRSASGLRAVPSVRRNDDGQLERFGTFELWHRSAREYPVTGYVTTMRPQDQVRQQSFRTLLGPIDQRLPLLASGGFSFLESIRHIPALATILRRHNVESAMVRANCTADSSVAENVTRIIIQPTQPALRDKFINNVRIYPRSIPEFEYSEFTDGGLITFKTCNCAMYYNPYKNRALMFPPGMALDSNNYMFYDDYAPLNGFGMYYVALFIIGNYARYYPDMWIKDIQYSSPLSLFVEELIDFAENMLPLLTLCELSRRYYVAEGLPLIF